MIKSPHVRLQRVTISVAKGGAMTHSLVVDTNLTESAPEMAELLTEIADYLKAHSELDRAEINCIATPS